MKPFLAQIVSGKSLSFSEAENAMEALVEGSVAPEVAGAFLVLLNQRGETVDELRGFLEVLKRRAIPLPTRRQDLIDTCGTGGDHSGTFNISTAVALLVASLGLGVAKHGNRSVSSRSGSADVLEALGIGIPSTPAAAARQLDETNFSFLFAPLFHPVLKQFASLRRALGVRTVFNALGPLLNPALVRRQVVGVYDQRLLLPFAELLRNAGLEEALVVRSRDGLDEISISAPTDVIHLKNGEIRSFVVTPEDFGIVRSAGHFLQGGDAVMNAEIIRNVLGGKDLGPRRDVVIVNAAAALFIAGKVVSFPDGAKLAREACAGGKGLQLIEALKDPAPRVEVANAG